jgi:hypothetical protein
VAAAGGIGGAGVPAFKSAMAAALKEFFNSADAQEVAARCVAVCCACANLEVLLVSD